MIEKTYRGPSFSELLERARAELGDAAVVVTSRRGADGLHEVVVHASSVAIAEAPETGRPLPAAALPSRRTEAEAEIERRLVGIGSGPALVEDLLGAARSRPREPDRALRARVAQLVRDGGARPRKEAPPRVVLLAGPMGGGKTTTAAKLAAWHRRRGDGSPVLATLDSFRAGAVAQLRTLAELVGVPFHVVAEPGELRALARSCAGARPLIVDTPGLVLSQEASREAVRAWAATLPAGSLHLVLPASTHPDYLDKVLAQAAELEPAALVVTRLDEHQSPGLLVGACARLRAPLAWTCSGPRIPSDLERPCPEALAQRFAPASTPASTGAVAVAGPWRASA